MYAVLLLVSYMTSTIRRCPREDSMGSESLERAYDFKCWIRDNEVLKIFIRCLVCAA